MLDKIDLSGVWQFYFKDSENEQGKKIDTINLPSTTEISKKGNDQPDLSQTLHLSRKYPFTGQACYIRKVAIPEEWRGFSIVLHLERTKYTKIYVDDHLVSKSRETIIPQHHDLTRSLMPGDHKLMIEVDNQLEDHQDFPNSLMNGHQYTDHTQTNWNGVIGEIFLERKAKDSLKQIQTYGDEKKQEIQIKAKWQGTDSITNLTVNGFRNDGQKLPEYNTQVEVIDGSIQLYYKIGDLVESWDEFHPSYYDLVLNTDGDEKEYKTRAYFQEKAVKDKRLVINRVPIFLRGTVDCAIFPLTGACPMDRESWKKIFRILKDYGFNHYRFHSWCPPKAAFEEADIAGIYLQIELSNFGNGLYERSSSFCDPVLNDYLWDQGKKILLEYGNHPSFTIFAIGNEMSGDLSAFQELIKDLRIIRPDKFYTQGANNFLENPIYSQDDDCFITMRTDQKTNIRGSFSHSDLPLGYLQGGNLPSTLHDYRIGVAQTDIPLISHEVGQYQSYPDYREIDKYSGPLACENLKIFKEDLKEKGMLHQAHDFFTSSGALAALCYTEDIESMIRTEGLSGFQLLGLQDFTGQGTALVGILNSFFESKNLISKDMWREFCAPVTLLAKFSKFVWTEGERLCLETMIGNYGNQTLEGELEVYLQDKDDQVLMSKRQKVTSHRGYLKTVGEIDFLLPQRGEPTQLFLVLKMGDYIKHYPLWIYEKKEQDIFLKRDREEYGVGNIPLISQTLDQEAYKALNEGRNVVLFHGRAKKACSVDGFFTSDFWCYPMFREACLNKGLPVAAGTMGMHCNKNHPALSLFPSENYSQWQWHTLLYYSRPIILDHWESSYQPLIQIIDNPQRNHKLGFLFEVQIGKGKLLCCACDVLSYLDHPEVYQFYKSVINYVSSKDFVPEFQVDILELEKIF